MNGVGAARKDLRSMPAISQKRCTTFCSKYVDISYSYPTTRREGSFGFQGRACVRLLSPSFLGQHSGRFFMQSMKEPMGAVKRRE